MFYVSILTIWRVATELPDNRKINVVATISGADDAIRRK